MITITPAAASLLARTIAAEPDSQLLGVKIVITTTGCSSYSYSIAITEPSSQDTVTMVEGIRVLTRPSDEAFLAGLIVDVNPISGRLCIHHTNPPQSGCTLLS
ncbi:MAG: HesB/IscA family protein [Clostridia bacterium]